LINNPTRSLPVTHQQCEFCHIPLFPELEEEDQQEEDQQEEDQQEEVQEETQPEPILTQPNYYERIRIRVQGDANIKNDLKLYLKAKYNQARKRTLLLKYTGEKKNEIKHSVDNLKEQLRALIRAQKRLIIQSQAYKDYKGAYFRKNIAGARFYKKYNLGINDLRKAMYGQPGYKRWRKESGWRNSPSYILRRGLFGSYFKI
jgi:hypothetical protein